VRLHLVRLGLAAIATATAPPSEAAGISPGAFELGVSGALTSAGETTTASVALRTAWFLPIGGSWIAPGADLAYVHVREHDAVDALANLAWAHRVGSTAAYPFVAITGGVRQDWQGSFREARFPVGASVGLRVFVGADAALLAEYRALRITGDPVADFSEHHLRLGASIFL